MDEFEIKNLYVRETYVAPPSKLNLVVEMGDGVTAFYVGPRTWWQRLKRWWKWLGREKVEIKT